MKYLPLAVVTLALTFLTTVTMADQDSPNTANNNANPEDLEACALPSHAETTTLETFKRSDDEWQKLLSPDQFRVMRQHGTEPSFRNAYWDNKDKGLYLCAACEAPLFASKEKFNSGTGWPSFWDTIAKENIGTTVDTSYGMTRTEVHCNRCGGHLGHVFGDGPRPTGLRYCINSASLEFVPKSEIEETDLAQYKKHAK